MTPEHTRIDATTTLYRTIFEHTGNATILIEEDMTISVVNSELVRILGLPKEAVENKMKFVQLIAEADRGKVIANHYLRRKSPGDAPRNYPCRIKIANDEIRECILTVALIKGTTQSVASITDISRQKELEREITRISDRERRQLGQVLHDDLGSHLAGVDAMSTLLSNRLTKQDHPDASLAGEIQTLINQAIKKTRAMVKGLLPVDLESQSLVDAMDRYMVEVKKAYNVEYRISSPGAIPVMEEGIKLHLYYIVRESVNNALRHGNASRIDIRLEESGSRLCLEIEDNGSGMTSDTARSQGSGITIMQQRADLIGADLNIDTTSPFGVTVRCTIEKRSV
ncbi:MAG: PAS domain-containing sensor histidine kinase [Desulfobacteraceae bacterium]|nr:MAG: PAS domain-containing sensor histidine kinase [Desulfobacteraceae bacterium]